MKRLLASLLGAGILAVLTYFILLDLKPSGDMYLTVGFSIEPPYSFIDSNGVVRGQSPDELRIVFKNVGIDSIQWRLTEFGSLVANLETGRIDAIAAGMFITPERATRILFSSPTLAVPASFFVEKGNPRRVNAYDDFIERPELRLGVLKGSVESSFAHARGIPPGNIYAFPDVESAIDALGRGEIECVALSSPSIANLQGQLARSSGRARKQYQEVIPYGDSPSGYPAFAFRKEDSLLVQKVNSFLESFVGSDEHLKVLRRYGFSEVHLPRRRTVNGVLREMSIGDFQD